MKSQLTIKDIQTKVLKRTLIVYECIEPGDDDEDFDSYQESIEIEPTKEGICLRCESLIPFEVIPILIESLQTHLNQHNAEKNK